MSSLLTDAFEAERDELAAEVKRLRKGIQDYLDGDYPHPRSYRGGGAQKQCPHGRYYYENCESCIDEHFHALLALRPQEGQDGL